MTNPYHDNNGRFCSSGEMSKAITTLFQTGRIEEAHALATELNEIEENKKNSKMLAKVDETKINKLSEVVNALRSRTNGFFPTALDPIEEEKLFNKYTDDDMDIIESIASVKIQDFKTDVLTRKEAKSQAEEKFFELAGVKTKEEASATINALNIETARDGKELINKIQTEAVGLGLPAGYANYFYRKLGAELGVSDGVTTETLRGPVHIPRATVNSVIDEKTLTPRARDKNFNSIIKVATANVLNNEESEVTAYNEAVNKVKTLRQALDTPESKILGKATTEYARRRNDVSNAQATLDTIHNNKELRRMLKEAGVTSDVPGNLTAGSLRPEDLKIDSSGKINNVWVISGDLKESRSVSRIVGVRASSFGSVLVDEKGREHYDQVHYHSYRQENITARVVVDSKISGKTNPAWAGTRFSSTIDSGD